MSLNIFVNNEVTIGIQRVREGVILPTFSKENAGIDLRLLTENRQSVIIKPHEVYKFYTGIKMDIPEGFYVEIVPRSSTGIKRTLRLANTVAILDPSWKGETLVFLENFGNEPVSVEDNERLCQMIVHKVWDTTIQEVYNVGTSERGEKGIGSSGRM